MTQAQLNRAVARATGERVQTIARMGFALACRPASRWRAKRAQRRRSRSKDRAAHLPQDCTAPVPQPV